jgi:hypothetical protein
VRIESTAAVADQVGGELPSQSSGKPVGPTGGDKPHARAGRGRAIASASVAAAAVTIIERATSMRGP